MNHKNIIVAFLDKNGIDGLEFVNKFDDSDFRIELWARYVESMNKTNRCGTRLFKSSHSEEKLTILVEAAERGVDIIPLLGFRPKQLKLLLECAQEGRDISGISRYIYNYKQLMVLVGAIKSGIDVSDMSDPELHFEQMRALVQYKEAGLRVSRLLEFYPCLASIPLSIVNCLSRFGTDVDLFPYLTYCTDGYKLSQIAYALSTGIDITKLLKYKSWKVVEEIRIAAVEGIDITADLTDSSTAEQAHNCRMAHLRKRARSKVHCCE